MRRSIVFLLVLVMVACGKDKENEAATALPTEFNMALNQWLAFSGGTVRMVGYEMPVTEYRGDYQPPDGMKLISYAMEWQCGKDECRGVEVANYASYVGQDKLIYDTAPYYYSDTLSVLGHDAVNGGVITGNIYFEVPIDDAEGYMRIKLDGWTFIFQREVATPAPEG